MAKKNNTLLKQNKEHLAIALMTLATLPFFLWGLGEYYGLVATVDVMGHLASAAFFNGHDWSGVISHSGFYTYGFGLLMTPLMRIFQDPVIFHRAGIVVNAIMAALVFPLSYYFGKSIAPTAGKPLLITSALAITLFHANIANTRILWSEILLILLFWLLCICLMKMSKKAEVSTSVITGFLLGYTYISHQRTLTIVFAGILVIVLLKLTKKITLKHLLITLSVTAAILLLHEAYLKPLIQANIWVRSDEGIVLSAGYGGAAFSGAALGNVVSVLETPIAAAAINTPPLHNDFAQVMGRVAQVFTVSGFSSLMRTLAGQIFAFGTTTLLFGFIGLAFLGIEIVSGIRAFIKEKKEFGAAFYVYIFILISLLFGIAISSVFFIYPDRFDHFLYERYIYNIMGPVMLIGMVKLLTSQISTAKKVLFSCILAFTVFAAISFFYISGFWYLEWLGGLTAVGMDIFRFLGFGAVNFALAFVVAILPASLLFIFFRWSKYFGSIMIAAMTLVFVFTGFFVINRLYIPHSQDAAEYIQIVEEMKNEYSDTPAFSSEYMHMSTLHMQFFYRDAEIRLLQGNEGVEFDDYLILTFERNPALAERYIIDNSINDIQFLVPKVSQDVVRYEYRFDGNETFFFNGFAAYDPGAILGYRWSIDGESLVLMSLERDDYVVSVHHDNMLIRQILEVRDLSFSFYLNDNYLGTLDGGYLVENTTVSLDMPQQYVIDGLNRFEVRYDPWSFIELGIDEFYLLGLAFTGISVERAELD